MYLHAQPTPPRPLPPLALSAGEERVALGKLGAWVSSQNWLAGAAEQPFRNNVHVFRAIHVIIATVLALPRVLKRNDEEVERGAAYELLHRPEQGVNYEDLFEEIVGCLNESGEAHVFDPEPGNVAPRKLVVAGRHEMTPVVHAGTRELLFWNWRYPGARKPVVILPEQHAYTRFWNPYHPWRGIGPAESFTLGLQADHLSQQHATTSLQEGAQPGGYFKFGHRLGDDERNEYRRAIEARHQGAAQSNRIAILEGDVDFHEVGWSNVDLQLLDLRRLNREEAFEAFGVPPVMAAIFDSAHFNVADAAQEIFLWTTIGGLINKIQGLFNDFLLPRVEEGVTLDIELGQHYVLQRIERQKIAQFAQLVEHFVPPNEAAAWLNLPFENIPHGDRGFVISGLQTTDDVVEGLGPMPGERDQGTEGSGDQAEGEGDEGDEGAQPEGENAASAGWLDDRQLAFAIRSDARHEAEMIRRAAGPIRARFRAFFVRQQHQLVRRLKAAMKSHQTAFATAGEAEQIVRRVLLDIGGEQSKLAQLAGQFFPDAVKNALRAELARLGFSEERIEQALARALKGRYYRALLRTKQLRIAGVERVTRRRVRAALLDGLRKNETVTELSGRIQGVLGGPQSRSNRIARTEAKQAVSTSRFIAAGAAGAKGKGWIHGRNPRPSHLAAQVRYHPRKGAIPLDRPFRVGKAQLMFPSDPSGPAEEVINCNCVMVTVRLKKQPDGQSAFEIVNVIGAVNIFDTRTAA